MLDLTDIKPGDTLGRYELLMPVAHGGMAAVWAARMVGSRGFQKLVAVKTMLPSLSDDPDFETMFLDEARLASRIHHPHVVEIVDLGDEHGWLYLVMEWVDGETISTLNKRAKTRGGIPLPLLLRIISSACAGLHAAHELRDEKTGQLLDLVHRDISPQNVMVSSNGIVKIVDFGVAKAAGRAHNTLDKGVMKGKVPYGSPEQLSGGKLDRRSDIFSLGILMYVMVSGFHPFRGETDVKTMENICKRIPVPLHELVPGVLSDVETVVMRALAKNPADRWPDCAAMQRAVDQALSAMGAAVTDGDVAAFVRSLAGDLIDARRSNLSTAIKNADIALGGPASEVPMSARGSGPRSRRSNGPLPATFKGILPVALEDTPPPPSTAPRKTIPGPIAPSSASSPAIVGLPAPRRRSSAPFIMLGALALAGASAFAVRAGYVPWVAQRLPAPVRDLLAPPAVVTTQSPANDPVAPLTTPPAQPPSATVEEPATTAAPGAAADALDASADAAPDAVADASPLDASADAAALDASADGAPPWPAAPFVPAPFQRKDDFFTPRPAPTPTRKLIENPYD